MGSRCLTIVEETPTRIQTRIGSGHSSPLGFCSSMPPTEDKPNKEVNTLKKRGDLAGASMKVDKTSKTSKKNEWRELTIPEKRRLGTWSAVEVVTMVVLMLVASLAWFNGLSKSINDFAEEN